MFQVQHYICQDCYNACLGYNEQLTFSLLTKLKEYKPGSLTQISEVVFTTIVEWESCVRQVKDSALSINMRDILLLNCKNLPFVHPTACKRQCDISRQLKLKFINVRCRFLSKELTRKSTEGFLGSKSMTAHQLAMSVR